MRSGTLQSSPIDTLVPPVTGLVPPVTDLDSEAPGLLFLEKEMELAGRPALPALPADGRAASSGLVAELTARSSKGVPKPHAVKMPGFSISRAIHLTHGLWLLGFESGPVVLSQGPFSPGDARPYLETPPVITLRGAGGQGEPVTSSRGRGSCPPHWARDRPVVTNDGARIAHTAAAEEPRGAPRSPELPRRRPPRFIPEGLRLALRE